MRKIAITLVILLLLALPASAFTGVSSANSQTTVDSNGSCFVTVSIQMTLDVMPETLVYPLPAKATNITVNGLLVSGAYSGSVRNVDLKNFVSVGTCSLVIRYRIADAITGDDDLTLSLELLSGFEYPIDRLDFSVTLPGPVDSQPHFTSTYFPDTIELMMDVRQQDNVISGSMATRLQDHEKLTMTLAVSEEMFPQPVIKRWSMDNLDLIMIILGFVALVYWLITMRNLPPIPTRRTMPPDGITAGELGCRLTGQGADLTMMVVSWAQMGYLLIQPDDNGRVLLHKRMDMGNERDEFELKCFRKLFGKRSIVDGTGYHYAQLCRKYRGHVPGAHELFLRRSGNPMLFRLPVAAIGLVSGISLGTAYVADSGWQVVLSIFLGALGAVAAWLMQGTAKAICSRHQFYLWAGLAAAGGWMLLSMPAGEWNVALCMIVAQMLCGLMSLYGGRRTEIGKMHMAQILGLQQYLRTIKPEELKRELRNNPHYYYDLAPYALALGVDREFAQALQKTRLSQCPWLTTGMDGHLTAPEWNQLLRDTVDSLDSMQRRLPLDRLLGK